MHQSISIGAVAVAVGAVLAAIPVSAVDLNKSRLTTIELKTCRQVARHNSGGAWTCPGLRGYPVYVAEIDRRQALGFGPTAQKRKSATQTLSSGNTIFDANGRATVEWRVETDARGRVVPFATIVRFHIAGKGERGDVLVVTKIDARESCQLALIDTAANTDAMAIARAWTIAEAKRRPCPATPDVIGKKGDPPM